MREIWFSAMIFFFAGFCDNGSPFDRIFGSGKNMMLIRWVALRITKIGNHPLSNQTSVKLVDLDKYVWAKEKNVLIHNDPFPQVFIKTKANFQTWFCFQNSFSVHHIDNQENWKSSIVKKTSLVITALPLIGFSLAEKIWC